nr:histidine kinase [Mobiluncus curtisii]
MVTTPPIPRQPGGNVDPARRRTLRGLVSNALLIVTFLVLFGVGILVVVQVGFLEPQENLAARGMLALVITLLMVVAVMLARIVQLGRDRVDELTLRNRQLELEREQSEQIAVADERARIAREMHDIVAHSLTVLIAMSDGATAAIDKNPELAKAALRNMSETGRAALADTRRLVGVLRQPTEVPQNLDPNAPQDAPTSSLEEVRFTPSPDLAEMEGLIAQFRAAGLPITYRYSGDEVPADGPLQLTIYRIVQESLTNILRHAPASTAVEVDLEVQGNGIHIVVFNATSLAGINPGGGKGLIGMRERAAVYDGHVEAGPTPGGWRVEASLHWQAETPKPEGWVMPA